MITEDSTRKWTFVTHNHPLIVGFQFVFADKSITYADTIKLDRHDLIRSFESLPSQYTLNIVDIIQDRVDRYRKEPTLCFYERRILELPHLVDDEKATRAGFMVGMLIKNVLWRKLNGGPYEVDTYDNPTQALSVVYEWYVSESDIEAQYTDDDVDTFMLRIIALRRRMQSLSTTV
jgi:hypothetical protein